MRKLIWPVIVVAYFHPMRMTYPILLGTILPGQHKNGESPPNSLFLGIFRAGQTCFLSAPFTAPWGKPSNLWDLWVSPFRPKGPSWIWIRCNNSATYRNTFISPLTFAMSTATCKSLRHSATSFLDNIFWRPSSLSPTATRTTHLGLTTSFLSLISNTTLLWL